MTYKEVTINKKKYRVNQDEYNKVDHEEYNNLHIIDQLGFHERQISLLSEISKIYKTNNNINNNINNINNINVKMNNVSHGGFIPINCSEFFNNIYINNNQKHNQNILHNIVNHLKNKNIFYNSYEGDFRDIYEINFDHPESSIIISLNSFLNSKIYKKYELTNLSTAWTPQPTLYIYVSQNMQEAFFNKFRYYIKDDKLDYDNLIHFCVMVKNGGSQFSDMLKKNMSIIDRWTILDTGSTDNTVEIINNTLVGSKDGELYQEPFINFRDSRNRCLDLAGKDCKFIIMLDDTYVVEGELRDFLNIVRGDQLATSFTLMIQSDDTQYGSNRIIKSDSDLRYIHKIHEVITDKNNINVVIPQHKAKILDGRFDYMEERTMKRKELDLKLLYEEVEDDPTNPRTYYYLGQTYNLLGQYDKAYHYFLKRGEFKNSGFIQERIDAVFEAARIANFKLNLPWEECVKLYEEAYKIDESRPDSIYFIGINHHLKGENKIAYEFFKKGFEIGYPSHCQYSLKPTLSFHFLPKFLTRICYEMDDYKLGEQASLFFLQNNPENAENYEEIKSYYMIYKKLNEYDHTNKTMKSSSPYQKPVFVFVADGGFNKWSGSNILTTGVGGSETYIIEMARYIQKNGTYQVLVFCNCENEENFEGVEYKHLSTFPSFINENYVEHCMISRFTEYLPLAFKGYAENVYLVLHDLGPSGCVIPMDYKLKNIFCLTEWHVEYFTKQFPSLKHLTVPFYYGIDFSKFKSDNTLTPSKDPFKFIYSSFPNRGLLPLLQMWPRIHKMNNKASLHIYSDVNGKWVNSVDPEHMKEIRRLLQENLHLNIHYYGWVDKKTLAESWLSSDIWFYPCIFMETFCLTALEAALTKTLVFTNDLAALQNTVGDRGIVIPGNPMNKDWQEKAIEKIGLYFSSKLQGDGRQIIYNNYRNRNHIWASNLSWENQANKLLNQYINPNYLEHKGSYDWYSTNKDMFNMILKNINSTNNGRILKILDVNSYTGISLINILKSIPSSIGYGIDNWDDLDKKENKDIRGSFSKNLIKSKLENRMFGINGDTIKILINMIENKEVYDIININYNEDKEEVNWDLYFKILNKGGIMIIDRYLFNPSDVQDNCVPLLKIKGDGKIYKKTYHNHSIKKFLQKYNDYKILGFSNQLFLEKL